jgi:hypothetical protein
MTQSWFVNATDYGTGYFRVEITLLSAANLTVPNYLLCYYIAEARKSATDEVHPTTVCDYNGYYLLS